MLALETDDFICDMAETYRVFDIRSIPLKLLATLANGLGANSRIRLKRDGLKAPWETVLMALLVDAFSPANSKSISESFLVKDNKKIQKSNSKVFGSIEEFEKEKAAIIGG